MLIYTPHPYYPSPGNGFPPPEPMPSAPRPDWNPPKRKRPNPKDPWYHAYSGDIWRRPRAREFYRFNLYHKWDMNMCRVDLCSYPGDPGSMRIDAPFRIAGPEFKDLAVDFGLRPVKRPNKYRKGMCIDFWNWPLGFVTD